MNKDNKILNDKELENVSGGTNVGGVCGFNNATIGAPTEAPEIEDSCFERSSIESVISPNFPSPEIDADNENSLTRPVGLFPGLSALP